MWLRLISIGLLGVLWTLVVAVLNLASESNESTVSEELFFAGGFLLIGALAYRVVRRAGCGRKRSFVTAAAISPATYLALLNAVLAVTS